MKYAKTTTLALFLCLQAGQGQALQDEQAAAEQQAEQRAGEALRRQAEREARELQHSERRAEHRAGSVEAEMRQAEARLEEAARRIAELSSRQLPRVGGQSWAFAFGTRPVIGITIDGDSESGPVEGVNVSGVSPGGAAFEAGLRAGDMITSINEEPLSAASSAEANAKLLEFMTAVETGDTLDLEYLRDGNVARVELQPQAPAERSFTFVSPNAPNAPVPPAAGVAPLPPTAVSRLHEFRVWRDDGWGDMEMIALTENLGRYFGTDKGLLVVRAPQDDAFQLQDGDVIRSIDGREPESISHAMRILSSYQPGEELEIEIMRDKRRQTLKVAMPDNRQSHLPGTVRPTSVVVDLLRQSERH